MFSVIRIQFISQYARRIKRIMLRAARKIAALQGDMPSLQTQETCNEIGTCNI